MKLPAPGRFIVFRAPSKPPARSLQRGLDESLLFFSKGSPNLADPDIFAKYTKLLLSSLGQDGTDIPQVLAHERNLNFPEVAARFRMIDDSGVPVVADYGDAWERVLTLRRNGPSRQAFRRLQRYTVSLQPHEIARGAPARCSGASTATLGCQRKARGRGGVVVGSKTSDRGGVRPAVWI